MEKIIQCRRSSFGSIDEIDGAALFLLDINELLSFADGSETPESLATRVGAEWNDRGLLIYFRGRFEQLRYPPPEPGIGINSKRDKLWELSDVYEIFIGPKAKETGLYKEFQVSPDSRWMDIDVNRQLGVSNHHWYSGMRCKSIVEQEIHLWTSVVELPWNCFGVHRKTEDLWNANFYRASGKYHGDELLAWSATGYGERCFHRPEHYGRIEFLK